MITQNIFHDVYIINLMDVQGNVHVYTCDFEFNEFIY